MASIIDNLIEQIQIGDNTNYIRIAASAYGICSSQADDQIKIVEMTGFTLIEGVTINIKFINANTATSPKLNVNNTGAKNIVLYGTTASGISNLTTGWQAGAILSLTYDGTNWVRTYSFNELNIPNVIAKTTSEWQSQSSYIPPKDAILIYTDRNSITINNRTYYVPGIKIGDGLAYGIDLPFVGDDIANQITTILNNHINNNIIHITNEERQLWNNKLNCEIDNEILVFNRS